MSGEAPVSAEMPRQNASLFMTVTISVALLLAGMAYAVQRWTELHRDISQKLGALAERDLQQLNEWRNERLAVGRSLQRDEVLVRLAEEWRKKPDDAVLLQALADRLRDQAADLLPLQQVLLAGEDRCVRLMPEPGVVIAPARSLRRSADAGDVRLGPAPSREGGARQLSLFIPLNSETGATFASLEILEDVATGMAAKLDSARRQFKTGGAFLLELDGRAVQVVGATGLFTPAEAVALAGTPFAAAILRGERGTLHGRDLQSRSTFSHAVDIPKTPWVLVHKVECAEVEGPFLRQALALTGIYLLLLWAGGASLHGLWKTIRQNRALAEQELTRQREALARQVDYLHRNDRHAMLVISPEGKLLEANARAAAMYGYSIGELRGLHLDDLHGNGASGTSAEASHRTQLDGSTFTSRHRKRDGGKFDVEVSLQPGEWQGQPCLHAVVRDISEGLRAEQQLRESEELYRSLFHGAHDALLVLDGERIIDCNSRALELYGWPQQELVGQSWLRLMPSDGNSAPQAAALLQGYVEQAGDRPLSRVELEQQRRDGSRLLAEVTLSPVRLGDRPVLQAIVRDITKQRHTEQELKRSRADLEEAEELARLGHWSVSLETRKFRCSRQLSTILALPAAGGEPDLDELLRHTDPSDRGLMMKSIDHTIRHGRQSALTLRFHRPDGKDLWLYVRISPRRNEAGVVTELFGTIMDVSAEKAAEAALHDSMTRYRSLVEQSPAIVYSRPICPDSPAAFVSPQIEAVTGFRPDEWLVTDTIANNILPEDCERVRDALAHCRAGRAAMSVEYRFRTRDERIVWLHDQATLLHDRAGRPLCIQGVLMDITARKSGEETLRLLETALASAANGVIITDTNGVIV